MVDHIKEQADKMRNANPTENSGSKS